MKMGPRMKRYSFLPVVSSLSRMSVPVMSLGMRSGVNWTRRNSRSSTSLTVRINMVFANPGIPIIKTWPLEMIAVRSWLMISVWPMMALPISWVITCVFRLMERTMASMRASVTGEGSGTRSAAGAATGFGTFAPAAWVVMSGT